MRQVKRMSYFKVLSLDGEVYYRDFGTSWTMKIGQVNANKLVA